MLKELTLGLTDLVFPTLCILCRQPLTPAERHEQLCLHCQKSVRVNQPPFCTQCSRPLTHLNHPFCRMCEKTPYYFDQAWGATIYDHSMKHLLYKFKYGNKTSLRHAFKQFLLRFIENSKLNMAVYDLIIPIPLHPARRRERGYNQAELLADGLSHHFHIPIQNKVLYRCRYTTNQAILSQKERWTNMQAAFKIRQSHTCHGKHILLIDDLYTTGVTTSEAARILKEAEAESVAVLTLSIALYN